MHKTRRHVTSVDVSSHILNSGHPGKLFISRTLGVMTNCHDSVLIVLLVAALQRNQGGETAQELISKIFGAFDGSFGANIA
jgi:hypothetical protein